MSKTVSHRRALELADEGGHFYRTDFQVHTPRDRMWKGPIPKNDAEREEWADAFVRACRDRDLHAVAISDHHDLTYFPYVKAAADRETEIDGEVLPPDERLVVFPAVELTLSVPCQALLILDADYPVDLLDDVLKALLITPHDSTAPQLPETKVLPDSGEVSVIEDRLNQHEAIRGRFILLPNVTPSGHKSLVRSQFQEKYKAVPSVGGYLDCSYEKLQQQKNEGDRRKLEGRDPKWGNKRLALFQTSDARTSDFSALGKNSTWVKWSNPTAEALRQACLAQDSRIAQTSPETPGRWVSRIEVSDSTFLGPLDVRFNPQYSALIGGRGTGKSTVLHYLRWALCDQPVNVLDSDDIVDPAVKQQQLVSATLKPKSASVTVHLMLNGTPHVVRRHSSDNSVELKVGDEEFEAVQESAIRHLFGIQAYSQKQLSSVAIKDDELLRFVQSPIKSQLDEIDYNIEEISSKIRENYVKLQSSRSLQAEIDEGKFKLSSLKQQAKTLRDSLRSVGEEDRETLNAKSGHDRIRNWQASAYEQLDELESGLLNLLELAEYANEQFALPEDVPVTLSDSVSNLSTKGSAAVANLKEVINEALTALRSTREVEGDVGQADKTLTSGIAVFDDKYQSVKDRADAEKEQLKILSELEQEQEAVSKQQERRQRNLEKLGNPRAIHEELREDLSRTRTARREVLQKEASRLSELSGGLIKAEMHSGRATAEVQEKLQGLITGSRVQAAKVQEVFESLSQKEDPLQVWELALRELELLALLGEDGEVEENDVKTLPELGFTQDHLQKMSRYLSADGWLELSLIDIPDLPEFSYKAKASSYIPFKAASAGQQATALLMSLLSESGSPLVIDQPEDDLDSETVEGVISSIWKAKSQRQLIFTSHNANLVVNGDADLVLACAYKNDSDQSEGHIEVRGSIDVSEVRDEVTRVMEGGERAFRLRKDKYGF